MSEACLVGCCELQVYPLVVRVFLVTMVMIFHFLVCCPTAWSGNAYLAWGCSESTDRPSIAHYTIFSWWHCSHDTN